MFSLEEDVEVSSHQKSVIMTARASYRLHSQIAKAVSWISVTFRVSDHSEVCRSYSTVIAATIMDKDTKWKVSKQLTKVIQVTLNPLERIKTPLTCWHSLFPHYVIACGLPA